MTGAVGIAYVTESASGARRTSHVVVGAGRSDAARTFGRLYRDALRRGQTVCWGDGDAVRVRRVLSRDDDGRVVATQVTYASGGRPVEVPAQ